MEFLVRMVEHHLYVVGQLVEGARSVPEAQLDSQISLSVEGIDESPTIRSLLSRLVGQMGMWNCSVSNREYDFAIESSESLESIQTRLESEGSTFLDNVRAVCGEGRLDETFVDTTCDPPRVFTYGAMIAHVITYAAHRRTLVTGALWTAGVKAISDDPLEWLTQPGPAPR